MAKQCFDTYSKGKAITFYQGKNEFLTVAQLFSKFHVEVLKVSKSAYVAGECEYNCPRSILSRCGTCKGPGLVCL